ncbi:hypothetical protein E2C01_063784 [Portunus trituberculatus]|uniref:Uncharacterized protein n=1 Tax=Portunus trituberculatus TaxID=210409 RepID=A0A5B7HI09_PORTR|nr:hypothetical protein [Portunus trituberculatus]
MQPQSAPNSEATPYPPCTVQCSNTVEIHRLDYTNQSPSYTQPLIAYGSTSAATLHIARCHAHIRGTTPLHPALGLHSTSVSCGTTSCYTSARGYTSCYTPTQDYILLHPSAGLHPATPQRGATPRYTQPRGNARWL